MKRFLFDSNAVTSFINRREPFSQRVRDTRLAGFALGTCEPVVVELFYGLELSQSRDANIIRLNHGLSRLCCWPFDRAASREYGRIAAALRKQGRPMQVIDMMLAAVAVSLGNCTVVTTDSDLNTIDGLSVENWDAAHTNEA